MLTNPIFVNGRSLSETMIRAFIQLENTGVSSPSRNGSVKALHDVTFQFENPRARHLFIQGRKSNIFQMIAETFWVMAGADVIDPYLSFFLPRASQYSDDGETWYSAYGPRLYAFNQFKDALNEFVTDGIETRRSTITIAMPHLDNREHINDVFGENHQWKDKSCNREILFFTTKDEYAGKYLFHTKVQQRSGDMLFGTGSINPFEFSFIQEMMFNQVAQVHNNVELGNYRWNVLNAHVYSDFQSQVDEALKTKTVTPPIADVRLQTIELDQWETFFSTLLSYYGAMITADDNVLKDELTTQVIQRLLDQVITDFGGKSDKTNQMWVYTRLVYAYIMGKRGMDYVMFADQVFSEQNVELLTVVNRSTFRKFKLL